MDNKLLVNTMQNRIAHRLISPYFGLSCLILVILSYFFIDRPLATYLYPISHPASPTYLLSFLKIFTDIGKAYYLISFFGALAVINYVWLKNKTMTRVLGFTLVSLVISSLICEVFKLVLARARPELFFQHQIYGFHFFSLDRFYKSFPSGHATAITAAMLSLCYLLNRYCLLFLTLLVTVCLSRLLLTEHYLSDVITGFYLGAVVSSYFYTLYAEATYLKGEI